MENMMVQKICDMQDFMYMPMEMPTQMMINPLMDWNLLLSSHYVEEAKRLITSKRSNDFLVSVSSLIRRIV